MTRKQQIAIDLFSSVYEYSLASGKKVFRKKDKHGEWATAIFDDKTFSFVPDRAVGIKSLARSKWAAKVLTEELRQTYDSLTEDQMRSMEEAARRSIAELSVKIAGFSS